MTGEVVKIEDELDQQRAGEAKRWYADSPGLEWHTFEELRAE